MLLTAGFRADLVHATRLLMRRPGHSIAVILCLAAGLTVSITTFSLITSLLYGDQPGIANRSRLVRTYLTYDAGGQHVSTNPLSRGDFEVLRNAGNSIGSLAAEGDVLMAAVGSHDVIGLAGAFVSGDYFEVLGTVPHLGRLLMPNDELGDASRVAVVSEHFWRTHLDASADAIGKSILLAASARWFFEMRLAWYSSAARSVWQSQFLWRLVCEQCSLVR